MNAHEVAHYREVPLYIRADYLAGSITLHLQDSRSGLQVSSPDGSFVDATQIPGTIVVNAADMLSSGPTTESIPGFIESFEPPLSAQEKRSIDEHPARFSFAYFCHPNMSAVIDALLEIWEEVAKKYEAITTA